MSSAIIHRKSIASADEFAELVLPPNSPHPATAPTPNWAEFKSPEPKPCGFLGWCYFLISFLAGYLVSALIHLIALVSLAVWVIRAEPRHSEPLSLAAQTAGVETTPELLSSSSAPTATTAGISTAPMIFTTDLPLEMTGPKLATGLENTDGTGSGMTIEVANIVGGQGPIGRSVKFFGTEANGKSFVFVLDASGSMNDGNRYQRATTELLRALEALDPEQEFCVIAFNNQAWPMLHNSLEQANLLPATQENITLLKIWLAGLRPVGWTDPRDAMDLALKLSPSGIFFLSDGEFKQGPPERKLGYVTLSKVNRSNREHVPIHTLAFEDQTNAPILRGMAKASGGSYRFVPAEK